ncbi:hypothetical protein B0H13DRAFT_1878947 [Mycena leptocephala]|nr:hypothetical protein B0H13DRAFT_1878947 [Mycena leptocephala]
MANIGRVELKAVRLSDIQAVRECGPESELAEEPMSVINFAIEWASALENGVKCRVLNSEHKYEQVPKKVNEPGLSQSQDPDQKLGFLREKGVLGIGAGAEENELCWGPFDQVTAMKIQSDMMNGLTSTQGPEQKWQRTFIDKDGVLPLACVAPPKIKINGNGTVNLKGEMKNEQSETAKGTSVTCIANPHTSPHYLDFSDCLFAEVPRSESHTQASPTAREPMRHIRIFTNRRGLDSQSTPGPGIQQLSRVLGFDFVLNSMRTRKLVRRLSESAPGAVRAMECVSRLGGLLAPENAVVLAQGWSVRGEKDEMKERGVPGAPIAQMLVQAWPEDTAAGSADSESILDRPIGDVMEENRLSGCDGRFTGNHFESPASLTLTTTFFVVDVLSNDVVAASHELWQCNNTYLRMICPISHGRACHHDIRPRIAPGPAPLRTPTWRREPAQWCSLTHLAASNSNSWCAQVEHALAHWALPTRSQPQHSRTCFAFIPSPPPPPKSLRTRIRLFHRTIDIMYMRASSAARNPASRAVHANRGGHGRRIGFPRIVHPRQCARSRRLRVDLARTPSCLREVESLATAMREYISHSELDYGSSATNLVRV